LHGALAHLLFPILEAARGIRPIHVDCLDQNGSIDIAKLSDVLGQCYGKFNDLIWDFIFFSPAALDAQKVRQHFAEKVLDISLGMLASNIGFGLARNHYPTCNSILFSSRSAIFLWDVDPRLAAAHFIT
jgi:hypothetical protein